jgi:hypothetical protein
LLAGIFALVVGQLFAISKGMPSIGMLPLALVYALYVTAALLLLKASVDLILRRPRWTVPLLGRRLGALASYLLLLLFVAQLTLLREGMIPSLSFGYDIAWTHRDVHTSTQSDRSASWQGRRPEPLLGRPIACRASCSRGGELCEKIVRDLCEDAHSTSPNAVQVELSVTVEDPFCYLPLLKRDRLPFTAAVRIRSVSPASRTSIDLSISGTVEQRSIGPMSCRTYLRKTAPPIEREIFKAMMSALSKKPKQSGK